MNKSPDAFRTISEVADFLETPAHVLRFWESRFPQIRPVKRAGGRRYYRPADVALLTGIKRLLHEEGMTIRGVQKILREQGVRHVSGVADDSAEPQDDDDLATALAQATGTPEVDAGLPPAEAETAQIIALQAALREPVAADPEPETDVADPAPEADPDPLPETEPATDWQSDVLPDDDDPAYQRDDSPPFVAAPPPPVTTAPPARSAPVVADLFARTAAPEPAPPAPPVAEAPMAVWADEADSTETTTDAAAEPPDSPAPVLKITRIGAASAPPAPATQPVPVSESQAEAQPAPAPQPVAEAQPMDAGPTLAQRLRAVSPDDLTPADWQRFAEIRDQALALRTRLSGPARAQG